MKLEGGMWFPDQEKHLIEVMNDPRTRRQVDGKLTYQFPKLEAALGFVKNWRTAVDVGGHVGLWSIHLCKRFQKVHAFEPASEHRECFLRNITSDNVELHECGLGNREGFASLKFMYGSTGSTQLDGDSGDVVVKRLDSLSLTQVDFMKIDVEGYEMFVVQGAEKTIRDNKPVMVVEQKPKGKAEHFGQTRFAAIELVQKWGAKVKREMSGDYILSWS